MCFFFHLINKRYFSFAQRIKKNDCHLKNEDSATGVSDDSGKHEKYARTTVPRYPRVRPIYSVRRRTRSVYKNPFGVCRCNCCCIRCVLKITTIVFVVHFCHIPRHPFSPIRGPSAAVCIHDGKRRTLEDRCLPEHDWYV